MHRVFGVIGSVVSSQLLFIWLFVILFGDDTPLKSVLGLSIGYGLIIGCALALADKATGRQLIPTLWASAVIGGVVAFLASLDVPEAYVDAHVLTPLAIITALGVLNGALYWCCAKVA